jgi:hypothetical protein
MTFTTACTRVLSLVIVGATLLACGGDDGDEAPAPKKVGFEILQMTPTGQMTVWLGQGITRDEFDALTVPTGWIKNQPRETDPDGGSFARSPDATVDGQFTDAEHFGFTWRHNATVLEANVPLDPQGLLRKNTIAKFHTLTYRAGKTLAVLVSPQGEAYVRVSRDANRTVETPTTPADWRLVAHPLQEELTVVLPNPTINIRCDNEDSFQGPVPELKDVAHAAQP